MQTAEWEVPPVETRLELLLRKRLFDVLELTRKSVWRNSVGKKVVSQDWGRCEVHVPSALP